MQITTQAVPTGEGIIHRRPQHCSLVVAATSHPEEFTWTAVKGKRMGLYRGRVREPVTVQIYTVIVVVVTWDKTARGYTRRHK